MKWALGSPAKLTRHYPFLRVVKRLSSDGRSGVMEQTPTAFGTLLRRLRMAAGLSQEALAERARISTEAVGSLERGSRKAPQRQTLALLIDALNVEGADRAELEHAAIRPSLPRRRGSSLDETVVASTSQLPAPLTTFIGRESDLQDVQEVLAHARLVSVVGPGGVGKSRLALEAARRAGKQFDAGVALVELAPIAAGASVISAFASALGVADEGHVRLRDRIAAACGDTRRLIVADNCEHVLDACSEVVFTLLNACPNVHFIATSREPLRVSGEHIVRLGPLSPEAALELFAERAKAIAPRLRFDPGELHVAGEICRRVDGIPLAIELAASRTDTFDLETILTRLRERFKLLSAGSRTTLPHHRTLRALVDWSHEFLEPDEASVFRRLGVFAGGCRLDDAEHVLGFDGVAPDVVWELLARLHDKSLVDVDRGDPPRFLMLQTIHDYAQERLAGASDSAELEIRYATHYLDLAIDAGPVLRSAAQGEAIERLSAEVDNIRAALTLSSGHTALRERGLLALGSLALYWMRTGALTEASARIEALTNDVREPTLGVARACVGGAFIEFNRRRFAEGNAYAARAYAAASSCGDEWMAIYASLAVCWGRSNAGESPDAAVRDAYERAKRLGDPWLLTSAAFEMGWSATARNDRAEAVRCFTEALDRARATGDAFMVCTCALQLGRALTETEPARAARLIGEATECLTPGAVLARSTCLEALVRIALKSERWDHAACLVGIASALRMTAGGPPMTELIDTVRRAGGGQAGDDRLTFRGGASVSDASDAVRAFLDDPDLKRLETTVRRTRGTRR